MARAEQFNLYVNPDTEKELYDFLKSFPKMVRSSWIKETLTARMRGESLSNSSLYGITTGKVEEPPSEANVIRYNGEQLDIDEEDLL